MQHKILDKPKNLLDLAKNQEIKLNRATSTLQKKIYRRKIFIYFVMGSIMVGTALLIYNKLVKYKEFRNNLDSDSSDLFDSLSSQLNEASNNSTQLQNIFNQLKNEVVNLNNSLAKTSNNLRNTKITLWCVSPEGYGHYEEKSCLDRLFIDGAQCKDQGIPDCIITWRSSFDCRTIINNFCSIPIALADKTLQMKAAEEAMNISMEIMTNITKQIVNGFPGYESLYNGLSGVIYYCLYAFMLGEVSPGIIILLTLLTNVVSDFIPCVGALDENEQPEIKEIFSESKIKNQDFLFDEPFLLSYSLKLKALEKAEQNNKKYLELDETAEKYRMLIYKYLPVRGIVGIISDMADIIDLSKEIPDKGTFANSIENGEEKMSDGSICLNKIIPFWERDQSGHKKITVANNTNSEYSTTSRLS